MLCSNPTTEVLLDSLALFTRWLTKAREVLVVVGLVANDVALVLLSATKYGSHFIQRWILNDNDVNKLHIRLITDYHWLVLESVCHLTHRVQAVGLLLQAVRGNQHGDLLLALGVHQVN